MACMRPGRSVTKSHPSGRAVPGWASWSARTAASRSWCVSPGARMILSRRRRPASVLVTLAADYYRWEREAMGWLVPRRDDAEVIGSIIPGRAEPSPRLAQKVNAEVANVQGAG